VSLSPYMREHVAIMLKQIKEAKDDGEALCAIGNAFVFMAWDNALDPHEMVRVSCETMDRLEAEESARVSN
jgi:hypothetical protein